jgi:hypothetical protein
MSQYPDAFMVHLQLCNKMKGDYYYYNSVLLSGASCPECYL